MNWHRLLKLADTNSNHSTQWNKNNKSTLEHLQPLFSLQFQTINITSWKDVSTLAPNAVFFLPNDTYTYEQSLGFFFAKNTIAKIPYLYRFDVMNLSATEQIELKEYTDHYFNGSLKRISTESNIDVKPLTQPFANSPLELAQLIEKLILADTDSDNDTDFDFSLPPDNSPSNSLQPQLTS